MSQDIPAAEPGPDGAPEHLPSRRSRRAWILPAFFLAIAFLALGTWCTYWADQRTDQYQLTYLGQRVYDGGRMYVDAWENKPPGVAWLGALAIAAAGGSQVGAWLLPGAVILAALGVFYYAAARVLGTFPARTGTVMAAIMTTLRIYDTPSIHPDCLSAAFDLAACSLWLLSMPRDQTESRLLPAFAAGVVWAASMTIKQTGVVGFLAVSVVTILVIAFRRDGRRESMIRFATTWAGFAAAIGCVVGVLIYRDTAGAAWQAIVVFNRELLTTETMTGALNKMPRVWDRLEPVSLMMWLAMTGLVVTIVSKLDRSVCVLAAATLLLWWAAQVFLALMGPSGSLRYWQATFPPMIWLAAIGVRSFELLYRRVAKGQRTALVVLLVSVSVVLGRPTLEYYVQGISRSFLAYKAEDRPRDRLVELGERVQEQVPVGKAIYVWSYDPGVYLYAQRHAASRFTYPRSAEQVREILSDLKAGRADALLVPKNGSRGFDVWCDEACQAEFQEILNDFDTPESIGDYLVHMRRD